jgi:hypothetical protein
MSPTKLLDLQSTDNLALRFYNSTSFKAGIQVATTAGDMIATSNIDDLAIRANTSADIVFAAGGNTERMRIDSTGNVGIGTTNPQSKLHIETGSGGTYTPNANHDDVTIEGSDNVGLQLFSPATSYQYIAFGDPDSLNVGYLRYHHGTNQMAFRTNGSDNMVINSIGNVGIGADSPSYRLTAYGSNSNSEIIASFGSGIGQDEYVAIGLSGYTAANGATKAGLALKRTSTYGVGELHFLNNNATDNSDMTLSDSKMMIDSSGNVGIGTDQPEVSLDLGSTDAIRVPNGPTGLRPTGILPGMIRYNTTTSEFEGYSGILNVSGSWGALGGGGTPTITKQLFQVTTAQSIFILTAGVNPQDANYVNIFIDGVYQNSGTYTVATASGVTTVTLNTNAPVGTSVEIISTT